MHAAIAERAGVSRPTVYKHVGDQSSVIAALLDREVARLLAEIETVLTARGSLRERFVDTVVFVVEYGRAHPLLSGALRNDPQLILPWFTTNAEPLIEQGVTFFAPHIKHASADGDFPDVDPRLVVEWAYRLIVSLLIAPSTMPSQSWEDIRDFVTGLLDIGGPVRRLRLARTRRHHRASSLIVASRELPVCGH